MCRIEVNSILLLISIPFGVEHIVMEYASNEENGCSNTPLQKRQRTEDNIRSAMLNLDVLDCPICFRTLSIPIFQCDNGHLACSFCCFKLSYKCPSCALPIGHNRCRAMETVLKSFFVPCKNAKHGCPENVSFGKESTHKKECNFSPCSCPVQDCNFTGSYKNLYDHYISSIHQKRKAYYLLYNTFFDGMSCFKMNISDKISIQREGKKGLLFPVQCFREPYGVYVTVSCIAPSTTDVGKYSYRLSYTLDGHTITYESPEMKMIREVSFQIPQHNYMLIPSSLLRGELLDMKLYIEELNKEQES